MIYDNRNKKRNSNTEATDSKHQKNQTWEKQHDNPRNKTVPHGNAEQLQNNAATNGWASPNQPRTARITQGNRNEFNPENE